MNTFSGRPERDSDDIEGAISRLYDECPLTVRVPWLRILRRLWQNPLRLPVRANDNNMFISRVCYGLAGKLGLTIDELREMDVDLHILAPTSDEDGALAALQRTALTAVRMTFPEISRIECRKAARSADPSADEPVLPERIIQEILAGLRHSDKDTGFADFLADRLRQSRITHIR